VIATAAATVLALIAAAGAPDDRGEARQLGDRQLAGQRLVTGFPGQSPPKALVNMIREGRIAGVILFAHNFDSEAEADALVERLRSIRRPRGLRQPLLVSVDQEGGLVKRLPGPSAMSAEEMGDAGGGAASRQGERTGAYLRRLGFNLNFAPVLDLGIPGAEIERTDRAFARSPKGVAKTGVAFARAMQAEGVAATAKHFPGFGRAGANTDDTAQVITASRMRLREEDERPFRRFVEADGSVVMLSNAEYPSLDRGRPAGLSRAIASRELRRVAGFDGVSITDSLDAAAITQTGPPEEVAEKGVRAGTDLLLFTSLDSAERAGRSVGRALRSGKLDRDRFLHSVERVLALRASLRG
jgi:beta-N-acetylhexosaminidase